MSQMATTSSQVFFPVVRYRDAAVAIAWLERAFGFTVNELTRAPDGTVVHAELDFGGEGIMVGSEPATGNGVVGPAAGGGWVYVAVDDPESLFDQAGALGAEVLRPLTETDYGSRECTLRDPEGHTWSFGTYRPQRV